MKKYFLYITLLLPMVINAQSFKERKQARLHYMDQNHTESFKEYSHLAQFMDPTDLSILAQHYQFGMGTERDKNMAIKYYKMAADLGDRMSQAELCSFYFDEENIDNEQQKNDLYKYSRMFNTNFEYSDDSNNTTDEAGYALYLCYKNGWGVQKNPLLADIWLAYAAFNDAMLAQDEFCEKYSIDGDCDTEEEELALAYVYYKHLYEQCLPYLKDEQSIETSFVRIKYLLAKGTRDNVLEGFKETTALYENNEVSIIGKAVLFDVIEQFAKYDNGIKEKYANDAEKYELISEMDKVTWEHIQLTKVIWKVDVFLNKTNRTTDSANGYNWVDLGLPSGTKWATCNIGANTPHASGDFFAWGETTPKKKFTSENYNTDRSLLIMSDIDDTARHINGRNWTVPSCEDWRELFLYCKSHFDDANNAIILTSPNNQSLTLPLVQNSEKDGVLYWTNTSVSAMSDIQEGKAISLFLESGPDWDLIFVSNWRGCQIRPILKK